jgi:uncharacterized protein YndB with AHSA1/START domain
VPDILHDFPVRAAPRAVFDAVSTPAGLDKWWTLSSSGAARPGAGWRLFFGPEHDWRATVSRCDPDRELELTIGDSDADWRGTRVGFLLTPGGDGTTHVAFRHAGWPEANAHYRTSSFCWAMYLRLLRLLLEEGVVVPYAERLSV